METVLSVVALLLVLFLVARGTPGRRWPVILVVVLAVILAVVGIERLGWWPETWRTR